MFTCSLKETYIMQKYDLVVKNGHIMDPASSFDGVLNLGVRNGKLVTLTTDDIPGEVEINAHGLIVSPGFIDVHTHADGESAGAVNLARLGITTAIGGNCGSLFSISKEEFEKLYLESKGEIYDLLQYKGDMGAFLEKTAAQGYPINLGMLTGAWYLRLKVGATDKRKPATQEQVQRLAALAEEAMQQGAFGVSFGLAYAPGTSQEELEALFAVAARYDGMAAVHPRYFGPDVFGLSKDAVDGELELIEAARKTRCPLQISHLGYQIDYISQPFDRLFNRSLEAIEQARAEGVDVMADSFPFAFASSVVGEPMTEALFSPQFRKKTGLDPAKNAIIYFGPHKGEKLTRELYAKLLQEAPNTGFYLPVPVSEELALRSMLPPWVMVCSDSAEMVLQPSQPFVLGRMVRELRMLSLMEALEKMTVLPARRMQLRDKGRIMASADADLVIFDPQQVAGILDAESPAEKVQGIQYVIVNGVVVLKDGIYQDVRPGKVLRHQVWQ